MPIYVYECETCGIRFERTQHLNDPPLERCPECGGQVHKIFQPVGIIFKGSGFYSTDHRRTKGLSSSETESGGKGKADKPSAESGSDKE